MVNRRNYGTVRRLPSGRWQARFYDPNTGEQVPARTTFPTKADAVRWLTMTETDKLRGTWRDPALGEIALRDWATRWRNSRTELKPKTALSYDSLLRSRILPALGDRPIGSIRTIDLQEWVAAMRGAGLSASRVRQASILLSGILQAAVVDGLIASNPAVGVRLPRLPATDMRVLTAAEVDRLATSITPRYRALVYVLAYGGLRYGEAAALRCANVNLDGRRIHISELLADVGGTLYFGPTKTHAARAVVMPGFLVPILERHISEDTAGEPHSLVFTSPDGTPLRYSNFVSRHWRPALSAAGLPRVGLHALRHTCASLLIAAGAPVRLVQAQLGHRSAELTLNRYGHLYPDDLSALSVHLDRVHERGQEPPNREL